MDLILEEARSAACLTESIFYFRAGTILCAAKTPPPEDSYPVPQQKKLPGALRHSRQTLSVSNAMHK
jgi:hypothetical protein